jgi:2-keto-4-pentenoate hydratase/2-oxohepta-3-ene-1,7-dioic acid hydratase in catechol pathway
VGRSHIAQGYQRHPDEFRLQALCDIDAARLAVVADEFSIPRRTTLFDELLRMDAIDIVDICNRLNYEGEIAIELGKRGVDLKPAQLTDYVWGVTMLGDWSSRAPGGLLGGPLNFAFPKNFDTSCSLGPCVAVGETDPANVDIETLVNGERRQRFKTRDMVFTFGEYLEYLSRDFTLYPGDIISGGTAAGMAADSSGLLPDGSSAPERFLKPGDLVEMNSPSIGSLRTRVVAKNKRNLSQTHKFIIRPALRQRRSMRRWCGGCHPACGRARRNISTRL